MLTRAAIYARFSSDKQSDASIEDQVHRARAFLEQQGVPAASAQIFTDYAISGASMERPGMRALEAEIRAGALDVVVTESVDRLSRDVGDADRFRKLLTHHDCALECLDGTRIASGKSDALMFGIRALFAEQYRTDLADKTRRGLEGRARAGGPTGGVPYGYRIVTSVAGPKSIAIDAVQADIVLRIFKQYLAGTSCRNIAAALNRDGVTPPRAHSRRTGQGWMQSAVRSMLLNASYIGRWSYGAREWTKTPGTNTRRPKARRAGALVVQERPELAIVDRTSFAAVAATFDARKGTRAKRANRKYVLSGVLKCVCGAGMTVNGPGERPYYRCSAAKNRGTCAHNRNLPVAKVEELVAGVLGERLRAAGPRILELATEELATAYAALPSRALKLREQVARRDRQIANLVGQLADSPSIAVGSRLKVLEREQEADQSSLLTLRDAQPGLATPAEYARRVQALEGIFDGAAPLENTRAELSALVGPEGIVCEPLTATSFEVRWTVHPGSLLSSEPGRRHRMVAGAGFEPTTFGL